MSLTTNIYAYYKIDSDNFSDATGNGRNGSPNAITYGSSYGKINDGASFNGTSSEVYIDYYAMFNSTNNWTFNVWVNPDLASTRNIIACNDANGSHGPAYDTFFAQIISDGHVNAWRGDGSGNVDSATSTGTISGGVWSMLTFTYDGSTLKIYINGSSDGSVASTKSTTALRGDLGASYQYGNFAAYYKGSMDEFGFWNRALSSTEVTQLYNGGAGLQYPFITTNGNFLAFM